MPRARRIYLETAVYYVTLEGSSHERVFRDKADYLKYMELLAKYKTEYRFKLFSYVLFPNQICLLIEPNEAFSISHIMQKLTPTYTKYYNARYDRKGNLFPKRFRSVYAEKDIYLSPLTRFIHFLPEHSEGVANFRDCPYSSYPAFAKTSAVPPMIKMSDEVEEVLSYLVNPNIEDAYERFMLSLTSEELKFLDEKLSRGAFLGSDEFISEVKKRMNAKPGRDANSDDAPQREVTPGPVSVVSKGMVGLAILSAVTIAASVSSVYLNHAIPVPKVAAPSIVETLSSTDSRGASNSVSRKPVDLNGTVWEVELISVSSNGTRAPVKDKIKFTGKAFESYYFSNQGFSRSNYTVTVHGGVITWETIQKNAAGETVNWRGDWQGGKMEGMLSYHPVGIGPQDFSFISNNLVVQK